MNMEKFFTLPDGSNAELVKLRLPDGFGADITNFGAIVGRIANRITAGRFEFDGELYQLYLNDNRRCSLHGSFGFSHRLWNIENVTDTELTLTLFSPHGDAGFPGNLFVRAAYRLLPEHTLELEISAESDRPTVADFTNHTYFNLDGENTASTDNHTIRINADRFTVTDEYLQPTGEVQTVTGNRFDLRSGKKFSTIFAEYDGGFDDNFILGDADHVYRENVAEVTAGTSGIKMTIHTSRPGIQFYMGGFLNDSGKSEYPRNSGFCLETQCWPDAVNHPDFPSVRIEPGRPHHSITRFVFSTK